MNGLLEESLLLDANFPEKKSINTIPESNYGSEFCPKSPDKNN